jgi:hypothetical protein
MPILIECFKVFATIFILESFAWGS